MNYTQWDYSGKYLLSDDTKMGMYKIFKHSASSVIGEYLEWLHNNHPEFISTFRGFIFSRLTEFKHFEIADSFFNIKPYQFDEKIANTMVLNMAIEFDNTVFEYWIKKVELLAASDKNDIYKNFWNEFLSFQFLRSEEFDDHIKNLKYVFDKVPFYAKNELDYRHYISGRANFFLKDIFRLTTEQQAQLLNQVGILCGKYYSDSKDIVLIEFENYPNVINAFDSVILHDNLYYKLSVKENIKKQKI